MKTNYVSPYRFYLVSEKEGRNVTTSRYATIEAANKYFSEDSEGLKNPRIVEADNATEAIK